MNETNALKISGLRFSYPATGVIINNLDLEVHNGSFNFIFGDNGAGKTTLIKLLLGLLKPESGNIEVFGEKHSQSVIAQNFGYVPQVTKIDRYFPISVHEIVELECHNNELCHTEPHSHLKRFRLDKLEKKRISELSGGELQKVLIARALSSNTKILVLDEPNNNLDKTSRKTLFDLLREINQKDGITVIVIAHHIEEVKQTDVIHRLVDGKVIYEQCC